MLEKLIQMYDSTNADESRMIDKQEQRSLALPVITGCRKYLNAMYKLLNEYLRASWLYPRLYHQGIID
jgi:hypothetical protein